MLSPAIEEGDLFVCPSLEEESNLPRARGSSNDPNRSRALPGT